MKAELKRLHSPDVLRLADFVPPDEDAFGLLIQLMAGPVGEDAEESFDLMLCTPVWLKDHLGSGPLMGRHYLFVQRYNYGALTDFLAKYCLSCEGSTWEEVAEKVGRMGAWEFEDYRPSAD